MRYGSFTNHVYDTARCVAPAVGMGATLLSWSDRHPATVVAVGPQSKAQPGLPTWVEVTEDEAKRTDSNGMSECQSYEFTTRPDGHRTRYTLRPGGVYRVKGGDRRILFGRRDKYHDFSF